jgi:hypothetical protein
MTPIAIPAMLMLTAISNVESVTGIFSLSKSSINKALDACEYALLLFGVLLALGIIGEYSKSEKWKVHKRTFEIMVIIGVAGEIFADGGIFLFSRNLQTISDHEIAVLNKEAGDARKAAGDAVERSNRANERASKSEELASSNEREAARLRKLAEDERLARVKIESRLAWRRIDEQQRKQIVRDLNGFKGRELRLGVINANREVDQFMEDLGFTLRATGISVEPLSATLSFRNVRPPIFMVAGDNQTLFARAIVSALVTAKVISPSEEFEIKRFATNADLLEIQISPRP